MSKQQSPIFISPQKPLREVLDELYRQLFENKEYDRAQTMADRVFTNCADGKTKLEDNLPIFREYFDIRMKLVLEYDTPGVDLKDASEKIIDYLKSVGCREDMQQLEADMAFCLPEDSLVPREEIYTQLLEYADISYQPERQQITATKDMTIWTIEQAAYATFCEVGDYVSAMKLDDMYTRETTGKSLDYGRLEKVIDIQYEDQQEKPKVNRYGVGGSAEAVQAKVEDELSKGGYYRLGELIRYRCEKAGSPGEIMDILREYVDLQYLPPIKVSGKGSIYGAANEAMKALKEAGMPDKVNELWERFAQADSLVSAAQIISEYVDVQITDMPLKDKPDKKKGKEGER